MRRGDVVILNVPSPDGTGPKIRPGLIVQADRYNRQHNTVISAITSSGNRMVGAKTQLLIDIKTPDGRNTRLRTVSIDPCNHLLTVDLSLLHRKVGQLSAGQMRQINDCLKESLEIR